MPDDPVAGFLSHLEVERRMSAHTLDAYRRDLGALATWADTHGFDLVSLSTERLRAFVAAEHRRGLTPKSLQRRLSACRSFYRWLLRHGRIGASRRYSVQPVRQRSGALDQLGNLARVDFGRRLPLGRTVVGVDVAFFALADLEDQGDVIPGDGVQTVARRVCGRRRGHGGGAGAEQQQQGENNRAHGNPPFSKPPQARAGRPAADHYKSSRMLPGSAAHSGLRAERSCCKALRPGIRRQTHP